MMFIIFFVINSDKHSIKIQQSFIRTGLLGKDNGFYYILYSIRLFINAITVPIMFIYVFSIDNACEETKLELVQNFTSLLILLEIDNLVATGLDSYLSNVKINEVFE